MNRSRLFLVFALIIVVIGAVVAFVLLGDDGVVDTAQQTDDNGDPATSVPRSESTPLPTITPIPFVEIVIAVQEIPRGVEIAPNAIALVPFPEEAAPFNAFTGEGAIEDVVGKIARTDIVREQPILQTMVTESLTGLVNVGSDAAAILPTNRVAVALPMDRLTSVAYAIQPGDRVDIMASLLFVDVDETFQTMEPNSFNLITVGQPTENGAIPLEIDPTTIRGTFDTRILPGGQSIAVIVSPSEQPRPRLATQRTVQDALVLYVGDFPRDGRIFAPAPTPTPVPTEAPETTTRTGDEPPPATPVPPRPDIITLAVSPQDAVVITWMVEAGLPLTFALRSASSTSLVQTDPVTLDYLMNRFNIQVPEKFTYSIEPAIRSIRQISVGERISLSGASTGTSGNTGGGNNN